LDNGFYGIYRSVYGNMNDQRAMSSAAVFGGIKIIAEDIGSLSLVTRQSLSASTSEPAIDHPLYSLLHDAPNPDMTAMEFREGLTAHALLVGVGYAGIERSKVDKRIVALWPWMPYDTRRDRDSRGRPVFIHRDGNDPERTYTQREVFVLNGFGLTGDGGLSLMQYARQTLGLTAAQEEYAARFFSQDQTPNLVLKHPGKLGAEGVRGVKEAWANNGRGSRSRRPEEDWHAPRVLQEGMAVEQLHPDNQKSQLIEQRAFQLLEVCRFLRLSPHKLADMSRATWGNVEQLNINHYTETLRPWCERWEQSIKLRCLFEEPRVYVKHNISGFLRGDFAAQTNGFARLLEKGVYSINEVRALMDLNPVEGGDEHLVQLNMQNVVDAANSIVDTPAPPMQQEPQPAKGVSPVHFDDQTKPYLNGRPM